MQITIEKLQLKDLDEFWQVFSQILSRDFPGYSPQVINYFLTRVYHKNAFSHWLNYDLRTILIAKVGPEALLPVKGLYPVQFYTGRAASTYGRVGNGAAIAGFAVLDKPYGGVSFLRWLGVLPEYRRKGIGRQLVEASIQEAKNSGCHKIELAGQPGSEEFYEKAGLTMEGKRSVSYFGIDQPIFGKVLGEPRDEIMTRE